MPPPINNKNKNQQQQQICCTKNMQYKCLPPYWSLYHRFWHVHSPFFPFIYFYRGWWRCCWRQDAGCWSRTSTQTTQCQWSVDLYNYPLDIGIQCIKPCITTTTSVMQCNVYCVLLLSYVDTPGIHNEIGIDLIADSSNNNNIDHNNNRKRIDSD